MFDSAVAAVSVSSSVLLATGLETPAELILAEGLVLGRIIFRLSRLLSISKSFQRQQQAAYRKLEINLSDAVDSYPPTPHMGHTTPAPFVGDLEMAPQWLNTPRLNDSTNFARGVSKYEHGLYDIDHTFSLTPRSSSRSM